VDPFASNGGFFVEIQGEFYGSYATSAIRRPVTSQTPATQPVGTDPNRGTTHDTTIGKLCSWRSAQSRWRTNRSRS